MTRRRCVRRLMVLPLAGSLAVGLGLLPTGAAQASAPTASKTAAGPGAHSAGDSLFPTIGNGGYDVDHYAIDLAYDRAAKTISATTTITATATMSLTSFSLDFEGLAVDSLEVDGQPASWKRSGTKLIVTPASTVSGDFRAVIGYSGKPVTHIDPDGADDGWIPTKDGATVLSEPVGAMTWFPDNNTPRDKATYDVSVRVPADLEVAGNGDLISRVASGSDVTWHWQQRRPMATYLAMISIGQYDVYHSTMKTTAGKTLPIWTFVDPKLGTLSGQRKLLPKIIRWQESKYGAYPQTSAGLVVKKLGVGYALETQNRPTFDGVPGTSTMVHELTHQWYGDSLTPKDWGDIWLNEGFATFGTWWWKADHGDESLRTRMKRVLAANPSSSDLWKPAPAALKKPKYLFSDAVYTRGGLTLEALREKVGTKTFRKILRRWTAEHSSGTVRTSQFIALAEQISGRHLGSFFHRWLYTAKRPSL